MIKKKRKIRKKDKFRFEVFHRYKAKGQKFCWRVISCNGNNICSAEMFGSEQMPRKTIKSLISAIKKGQYRVVEDLVNE